MVQGKPSTEQAPDPPPGNADSDHWRSIMFESFTGSKEGRMFYAALLSHHKLKPSAGTPYAAAVELLPTQQPHSALQVLAQGAAGKPTDIFA